MGARWAVSVALAIVASAAFATAAQAEALVPLAGPWGSAPIFATAPPGDGRLFVVERGGAIRVVKDGVLQPAPFLTVNVNTAGERGLLSMAFAPDYATSGLFYVFYNAAGPDALDPTGLPGDVRVVEYHVSSNPDVADAGSARRVLKQTHSAINHNGGQLLFGPDGLLYVTIGDGAVGSNAQTLANLLGKVLRIDPRLSTTPYTIPSSNPFVGRAGARAEIYALGLRNPFRASFDRVNGDLIVADVGEGTWEEVDVGSHTGGVPGDNTMLGANLGWPNCEGTCSTPAGVFQPQFQYDHTVGCAIVGGFVVHDPTLPNLNGRYLYGDFCRPDLRTLALHAAGSDPQAAGLNVGANTLYSFGEDARGCVYVMADAKIYRVAASAADTFACANPVTPAFAGLGAPSGPGPGPSPGTGGNPPGGGESGGGLAGGGAGGGGGGPGITPAPVDRTPPALKRTGSTRQRLGRTVRVTLGCDEDCALAARGSLSLSSGTAASKRLRGDSARVAGGARTTLVLRLSKKLLTRAKHVVRKRGRATAVVAVTATDAAGNAARGTLRIALR